MVLLYTVHVDNVNLVLGLSCLSSVSNSRLKMRVILIGTWRTAPLGKSRLPRGSLHDDNYESAGVADNHPGADIYGSLGTLAATPRRRSSPVSGELWATAGADHTGAQRRHIGADTIVVGIARPACGLADRRAGMFGHCRAGPADPRSAHCAPGYGAQACSLAPPPLFP